MSSWDWKKQPLRYDPSRGYQLCEPCWNSRHFNPPYIDADGIKRPKVANCMEGGCQCGCIHGLPGRRPRFTGEVQMEIPTENPLQIKADS